jgi:hypothetical protein
MRVAVAVREVQVMPYRRAVLVVQRLTVVLMGVLGGV